MKKIWKKYKFWLLLVLISFIGINGYRNIPEYFFFSKEEFFNNAVKMSYDESYSGIVEKKYYDKYNHGRNIIVIENNGIDRKLDYIYHGQGLYDFIKLGDSILKNNNSNSIRLKRNKLDTIIFLRFENIIGAKIYSEKNEMLEK